MWPHSSTQPVGTEPHAHRSDSPCTSGQRTLLKCITTRFLHSSEMLVWVCPQKLRDCVTALVAMSGVRRLDCWSSKILESGPTASRSRARRQLRVQFHGDLRLEGIVQFLTFSDLCCLHPVGLAPPPSGGIRYRRREGLDECSRGHLVKLAAVGIVATLRVIFLIWPYDGPRGEWLVQGLVAQEVGGCWCWGLT